MPKILIVDDASLIRVVLKEIISNKGFEIVGEAKDGFEAVSKYKIYSPDIVIMDITMPGFNGIEALKQILAINPQAKVIICSSLGQKQLVAEAIQIGACDFIVKPFKNDRVLEAIHRVCNTASL